MKHHLGLDGSVDHDLDLLGRRMIDLWQRRDPFRAAPFGFEAAGHRLPDLSADGTEDLADGYAQIAVAADRLLHESLPGDEPCVEDRLSAEVLAEQGASIAETLRSGFERRTVNTVREFSAATVLAALGKSQVPANAAQAHLNRLASLPDFVTDEIEALKEGEAAGWAPTLGALSRAGQELEAQQALLLRAEDHPAVTCLSEGQDRAAAARMLGDIAPDVQRCRAAYAELMPGARGEDREGLCWVEGGPAAYAALLREETTLSTSAEAVHEWALEEHARVLELAAAEGVSPEADRRASMDATLLPGPDFLRAAQELMNRALAGLPEFFAHDVPDCPVLEMPAATAARYGAGQYMPGSVDGQVSGRLYVNTTRSRPAAEVPGLVTGGAVPGSHVFWSIAFGAPIPLFRRVVFVPAFVKGWAAHSLTIADQMGLFESPEARRSLWAKRLANVARAVVDTGIHVHGWSRTRAHEFFANGTFQSEPDVQLDIARMLSLPGDGTIFALGAREIGAAHADTQAQLGGAFSERAFHGELLSHGALPMASMRRVIDHVARAQEAHR